MNSVDLKFINSFNDIEENGISNKGEKVRTKWGDGTQAYTKSVFCQVNRYDLSEGFPILSLRRIYWKSAIDEILWLFAKNSNNVKDLNSKVWESWADEDGSIGECYGWELGRTIDFSDTPKPMSQVDRLIYLIRNDKNNRRMITSMFNFDSMKKMGLFPCAYNQMWKITGNKLNMTLVQRSGDFLSASGCGSWNVVQYAVLLHMVAKITGYEVGELVHVVNDSHVYDRHQEIVDDLIYKSYAEGYNEKMEDLPKLIIKGNQTELKDFKVEDFKLVGYKWFRRTAKFEVAI